MVLYKLQLKVLSDINHVVPYEEQLLRPVYL